MASAAVPVTDPYLIDRMTAVAALKDCDVVVCVNKWDLAPDMGLTAIYRARPAFPLWRSAPRQGRAWRSCGGF